MQLYFIVHTLCNVWCITFRTRLLGSTVTIWFYYDIDSYTFERKGTYLF